MTSGTSSTKMRRSNLPVTFASLRFTGENLRPLFWSKMLGLEPVLAYQAGDVFFAGRAKTRQVRKLGAWIFSTEGVVRSVDPDAHILFIENLLKKRRADITAGLRSSGERMLVSIFWHGGSDQALPLVGRHFDTLVKSIGGTVELDFDRDSVGTIKEAAL